LKDKQTRIAICGAMVNLFRVLTKYYPDDTHYEFYEFFKQLAKDLQDLEDSDINQEEEKNGQDFTTDE
jgi:hypothetical protein